VRKIVLISCVSKKLATKSRACDLYTSPLFRLSWVYANRLLPDAVFILSAKYRLVAPEQEIEPYDTTLNDMSSRDLVDWADGVLAQLGEHADLKRDHFIFLAGYKYRQQLIRKMVSYEVPMLGLPIGKQLQYLKRQTQ
jgi:hypothetical protein